MKKICFVTASRSEYGLLKWLMREVDDSPVFELQLIVTGGHLLWSQGHTVDQIIEDGFIINSILDINLEVDTKESIAASLGRMEEKIASLYANLSPDYIVVLGDRCELLAICGAAFVMSIPIIHISGGDITEGVIDNGIRNAITMLSSFHFPGTKDSAENIYRMRGSKKNIWVVGEPGLDAYYKENIINRKELAANYGLEISSKWVLMTYHPETEQDSDDIETVNNCYNALKMFDNIQVIMTYANTDYGGKKINELLEKIAIKDEKRFLCFPSLGNTKYLSFMRESALVIGNSSSGIVEAPFLQIPVVNIGNRQKGRHLCSNVIQCDKQYNDIYRAIDTALNQPVNVSDTQYWGDGHSSRRIMSILRDVL